MKPWVEEGAGSDQGQRSEAGLYLGMVAEKEEERRNRTELMYGVHLKWAGTKWGQETGGEKRIEGLTTEPGRWQVELGKKRMTENYQVHLSTIVLEG